MTDTQPSSRTRFLAGSLLWVLWLVSASPFFSLFIEFRGRQLGDCGAEWWYYARFNPNLFLYPVTFGLISTILLHHPWIQSVHYLCCLPKRPRIKITGVIVVSILLVVGFLTYVEFFSEPPSGTVTSCDDADSTKFNRYTPQFWFFTPANMKEELRDLLMARCKDASAPLIDLDKCKLREGLRNLWLDRDHDGCSSLSITKQFYHAGFIAMTTLFALLFVTVFIVIAWNLKNRKAPAGVGSSESGRMAILLMHAFPFAMFWVLMWTTFLIEQGSTYPEAPLLIYNWWIWSVFAFVYACLVISLWFELRRYYQDRILAIVVAVFGIASGVIGSLDQKWFQEWISDTLVDTFGTRGSLLSYSIVFLFLLVIYFRPVLRLLEDDPKPDGPERPGTP